MANGLTTATAPAPVLPARNETTAPADVRTPTAGFHGVFASVLASVAFAALFLVPGMLRGLDTFATFGWRVLATLPFLAVILSAMRQWGQMGALVRRIARRPLLLGIIAIDGLLFGLQIYLFAWGPLTGNALSVSLGYFLLPLVLVALGVIVYRERISWPRGIAVALATTGVLIAFAAGASISWATFAVAFGYPAYFMLRSRFQVDTPSALTLEVAVLAPASAMLVLRPEALEPFLGHPDNWAGAALLGLLTAIGFCAYTIAQRSLPMSLFGLLTYLEPILLVIASVLVLAEPLGLADSLSYGAIGLAIAVLAFDSTRRRTPLPDK